MANDIQRSQTWGTRLVLRRAEIVWYSLCELRYCSTEIADTDVRPLSLSCTQFEVHQDIPI